MVSVTATPNKNNLDLVRFVLAAMVCMAHTHDLSGVSALSILPMIFSSTLAVQAFFVISGFLIFQSYDRSSSLSSYASKRVRRIMPAYIVVVLGCALLLGLISNLDFVTYVTSAGFWKYIGANLVFLNFLAPDLPGVFQNNLFHSVNGALWTLKVEVSFYIAVPICVWLFRQFGRTLMMTIIYLASALYATGVIYLAETWHSAGLIELSRQLPGQMTYFIAGAAIYYNFEHFRRWPIATLILGAVLFWLSSYVFELWLRPLGVALCVMSVAFGPYQGHFGRYGDFSYGVYIVHFPILQTLISLGLPQYSLPVFLLASVFLVSIAAVLMWHLVEKRFLRRDSHYRQETATRGHNMDSALGTGST